VARGVGSEFKTQYRKKKSSCPERCPYIWGIMREYIENLESVSQTWIQVFSAV
jgi:hypothetical protein